MNDRTRTQTTRALGAAAAIGPLLVAGVHPDDAAAKTYKVKNKRSHGKGSLNKAIKRANGHKGKDRIIFRSRLSGDIRARRGTKRHLKVTDALKIAGPGRGRVALRGPAKGSVLKFDGSGKSVVRGMTFKAVAIDAEYGRELRITNSRLSGKGVSGLGVSTYYTDARISRSVIKGFGGGVGIARSAARIDRSQVKGNRSVGGVGVYRGHVDITKSTISGNEASDGTDSLPATGGGVEAGYYGSATIKNSTISGNAAVGTGSRGGGVYGDVDVTASTVTNNSASDGGGIYAADFYGPARIIDSIVVKNSAASGHDCSGTGLKSKGENVFGPEGCGAPRPTDVLTAEPGIGPLADNGGRTPTHALLPGSPAIDNATDIVLKRDQRGVRRGKHPDSGSFERR